MIILNKVSGFFAPRTEILIDFLIERDLSTKAVFPSLSLITTPSFQKESEIVPVKEK